MKLAIVGLGKMGFNMAKRLMSNGHECVVFDMNKDSVKKLRLAGGFANSINHS